MSRRTSTTILGAAALTVVWILLCANASAQYITKAITTCAPTVRPNTKQVALDDLFGVYGELPATMVPPAPPKLVRFDIRDGSSTTLRQFQLNVTTSQPMSAIVTNNSAEIYVVDFDDAVAGRYAIYRTLNRGFSWAKVRDNIDGYGCLPVLLTSRDGGMVYWWDSCSGVVERSLDHGATWLPSFIGGSSAYLIFGRADPAIVYRHNVFVLYRSADYGATWTDAAMRGFSPNLYFVGTTDGVEPSTVYLVVNGNGGIRYEYSRNGGDDWTVLGSAGYPGGSVFATSPEVAGLVYTLAGVPTQFYRSTDHGAHWTKIQVPAGMTVGCGRGGWLTVGRKSGRSVPLYPEDSLVVLYDSPLPLSQVGVYRPSANQYFLDFDADRTTDQWTGFGAPGDAAMSADINGDGFADFVLYRNGVWFIDTDRNGNADLVAGFGGAPGDVPLAADVDGDGVADRVIYRGGVWYVDKNFDGTADAIYGFGGAPGDVPLLGDLNGDGKQDLIIYRNGFWFADFDRDGHADAIYGFGGVPGDVPLVFDFDGDGRDDLVIFRNGVWYVSTNRDGNANFVFGYGRASDLPLAGRWK